MVKTGFLFGTLVLVGVMGVFSPVQAQEGGPLFDNLETPVVEEQAARRPIAAAALKNLARDFVRRMDKGFATADEYIARLRPDDIRRQRAFTDIPDGEMLLLEVQLGQANTMIKIDRPVTAIKQGRDVMISLSDFVTAANFAVRVDASSRTAEGWYIRENQPFSLDIGAGRIQAGTRVFGLKPEDTLVQDSDIYIRGQSLAHWFDFDLFTNLGQQSMEVSTRQKWPVQEHKERMERGDRTPGNQPPPQLPRLDSPYKLVSVPNIDIFTRSTYDRPGNTRKGESFHGYTVQTGGDLLGHTVQSTTIGNKVDKVLTSRVTFSRDSEDAELLGPLKARHYEFGDARTVSVPLAGSSPAEMGVRVTSKDPLQSYDTLTTVSGQAPPGWDIELYRNDQYQDVVVAGVDGRYVFEDVLLYAGDNRFKTVLYGPQGEIREEYQTIAVNPALYESKKGLYDFSVTMQNTNTYDKVPDDDIDRETPHLAGTYEYQLDPSTTLRGGFRSRSEGDSDKLYLQAGGVKVVGKTILNADIAQDIDGPYMASVTARHRFQDHNVLATARYATEDYTPGRDDSDTRPGFYSLLGAVRGSIPLMDKKKSTYEAKTEYIARTDNSSLHTADLSTTRRQGKLVIGNTLSYTKETSTEGLSTTNVEGAFNVRGGLRGVNWRATSLYDIYPQYQTRAYLLELSKRFDKKLSGELEVKYEKLTNYKEATATLNWLGQHATVSPRVTYDSENNLSALMNVKFGLSYDPYNSDLIMSGRSLASSGGISAHVFLDRNGDNVFSEGDENIEGATVVAIHARRQGFTDENGETFIYNLPVDKVTDVRIQDDTLFDPAWISGFSGVSIRPRPGHVARLEFPIHNGGEMDGTLLATTPLGKPRPVKNTTLNLHNGDGKVVMSAITGPDGFYLFTKIPPGHYFMLPDVRDLAAQKLLSPKPLPLTFTFDGTIMYGKNIVLQPAGVQTVGVTIAENPPPYMEQYDGLTPEMMKDARYVLNLGSYNSNLLMSVVWYRLSTRYAPILADARRLATLAGTMTDPENNMHTLRVRTTDRTFDQAYNRCRALAARGLYCDVEILPAGLPEQKQALYLGIKKDEQQPATAQE